MTDNEKLARWQGWEPHDRGGWCSPSQFWFKSYPDYLNDDAAAMSLLDTLVEKGYQPVLSYEAYVSCHEAVVATMLELKRVEVSDV